MNQKTKMAALAAVAMFAIAVPLTITTSTAQETKTDQQATPPPFGGQGGPATQPAGAPRGQFAPVPMGPGGMQGMGGGGGGGIAMVEDGTFLYIVQGNRVFKLNKSDLKIAAQGELPRPMGGPGGPPMPPGSGGIGGEAPRSGK